jgi:biotin transport system substrate-specific component
MPDSAARSRTYDLATAALLAALMAGTSMITIPFGPVPVTLQTTFVVLAALLLAPGWAAASMTVYLVLGAVGLPVFAGAAGGLGALLGPTGGFLVAFPIAAAAGAFVMHLGSGERSAIREPGTTVMAAVVVEIVIYAIGIPWLMVQTGMPLSKAFAVAVLPFVIPDVLKIAIAVVIARAVNRAMPTR